MEYGREISLDPVSYLLHGYEFAGWNTQPDGTGDAYDDGEAVFNLAEPGERITLYAQWKPCSYEITFLPGEGL